MKNRKNIETTFHYFLTFFTFLTQTLHAYAQLSHNISAFNSNSTAPPLQIQALEAKENINIELGLIIDMRSFVGKSIYSSINMAITDFYSINSAYKTRIVLHSRDSKGDPLLALSAANDLVEKYKVEAIMGPQTYLEAKFLAVFSNKSKVSIFSFTSSPPSFTQYPYFVQIGRDECTQFKAIASLVESFKWRNVIFIYEATDYGREILPYMVESFLEKDIKIAYTSAISPLLDQILEELHKLMTMRTTIFIVHMSPFLASNFFSQARRLGMVGEEYVWILTDTTMDVLHTSDSELVESLQGVIGLRSYVPPSNELRNFTLRWRKEQVKKDPNMEGKEISIYGILAYDAIWSLAKAIERIGLADIGVSKSAKTLVSEVSKIRIEGLSGEYELVNGKLIARPIEVVNVIGKYERRVGFWTLKTGIMKKIKKSPSSSISSGLEAIMWPGGSMTTPKGWLIRRSGKKLRIGVVNNFQFKELLYAERNNKTNDTIVTGFCIDVFHAAIEALTYKVDYEFVPFLGAVEGWTYNDFVYQVYRQKYDALVGDITITANRSQYVDFTLPYTDMGVGTIAKRVDQKDIWIFLKPLDKDLWLTSLAFFIFTGVVVWVIEHPSNSEFQGSPSQQIGSIFWFTFSTLVFAHREKLTNNLSKFVVVVWLFTVLILTSSYTATLTSLLTVQQIGLTTKADYIGYHTGPFMQRVIVNNLNFEDYKLRHYGSPEEYADALSRGSKNGGTSAILDEIPYLKIFLAKYPNDYAMVASQPITNGFGFAFRKGSPLVSDLSREIAKLREEGKLMEMEEKWFKSESSLVNLDSVTKPKTLDFYSFRGLFLVTGLTSTLALVIFLIDLLRQYLTQLVNKYIIRLLGGARRSLMANYLLTRNANLIHEINVR